MVDFGHLLIRRGVVEAGACLSDYMMLLVLEGHAKGEVLGLDTSTWSVMRPEDRKRCTSTGTALWTGAEQEFPRCRYS